MIYKGLQLDRFQEEALEAINRDNSVIVTAPTGAGKTVIAEYAVEKCIQENHRVIYTAPIKALSNQKYRDFYAEYGEKIGIVTGDIVLNPYSQVLLMTTEIFRNMIFDDIERLNDVSYVIFDEIHYINDIERGTVWEESLIFGPQHIKFVCLSATIPNINHFAEWMQSIREIEIEVVEEGNRPVPLEHHLYFPGYGIGTLKHVETIQKMALQNKCKESKRNESKPTLPAGMIQTELIPYLQSERRLPCLYFCFSRKGCESNARYYGSGVHDSLLNPSQQAEILEQFDALCTQFDIAADKEIAEFRRLISNGIAYHHAGMLPTLKEVVERLFTSGLIQLLFTTETFAVGINMPACTVVFDSLEKYDGVGFRHLRAREYHQMAGRAGRRGIDTIGYVYAQIPPRYIDREAVRNVVNNKIEPIESQFNLSYSSILNLYEKYGEDIYDVYTMSLSNHQNYTRIAGLNNQIQVLDERCQALARPTCIHEGVDATEQIETHYRLKRDTDRELQRVHAEMARIKSETRGKKKKALRVKKLAPIFKRIKQIQNTAIQSLCEECTQFKQCNGRYKRIRRQERRVQKLKRETMVIENYPRTQIAAKLKVLKELGYIEGQTLLPRGKIASHIYGYELQLTQLLFRDFFERLTENEINCMMVAIVSEPRKDTYYKRLKNQRLLDTLSAVADEILSLQHLERKHNIAETVPMLEPQLCSAMLAWSSGCDFDTLEKYADMDPGDFVRTFRLVIDQLRQILRAMDGHTALIDKLKRCIDKINRDVVDAERQLRIGQEDTAQPETQTE